MKAGPQGWKAYEVYSPVRLDHLALAGYAASDATATFPDQGVAPSLPPGVVVNLNQIQWTPLSDPVGGTSYRRSSTHARLIWGKNAQISLSASIPVRIAAPPEDQLACDPRHAGPGRDGPTFPPPGRRRCSRPAASCLPVGTPAPTCSTSSARTPDRWRAKQRALMSRFNQSRRSSRRFTFSEGPIG
jgi:hypothetical protein